MKRFLLFAYILTFIVASAMAERIGTMRINRVECKYDTLVHRHVGPGVTYTQFQFKEMKITSGIPYKMRVHLFTIDMTNQYNRVSPYMSMDTYYESATQEQEVRRHRRLGMKPFATVNGCAFVQSPPGPGEPHGYMETINHLVTDGLIRYEAEGSSTRYYTDDFKKGNVSNLAMKATVTSSRGATAEIGQINHYRDFVRNKNKLALFCNDMSSAKDTRPEDGVEVFLKGDPIRVGTNKLQVVRRIGGCGDYIEKGQCVITGVGAEMEAFLNGLESGETVTIDVNYVDAKGKSVLPTDTYTAFIANCVKEGVAAGWAKENYAISATGVSRNGNTLYLADLEISPNSNAPCRCLEDFLIAVGAWNACYNDGGPSAEMTVDGKFVTYNSIGGGFNGRYCPNGVMMFSTAPADYELASLECDDPSMKNLQVGETFDIKLYGYNKYGEMIDDYAVMNHNVEVSCLEDIGEIDEYGTFTATKDGYGTIVVTMNGETQLQIPIVVGRLGEKLIITPSSVFTGEYRPVQLKVKYTFGETVTDLDPSLLKWSTDAPYVVSSCSDGLITPYVDGYATVTAKFNTVSATIGVEVENLEADDIPYIDLTDYVTTASDIDLQLPSVPHALLVETRSTEDSIRIELKYVAGGKDCVAELRNEGKYMLNIDTVGFAYDAPDTYPIVIKSLSPETAKIKRLVAIYTGYPTALNDLQVEESKQFEFSRSGEILTMTNRSDATSVKVTVYSISSAKLAEAQTELPDGGSCSLTVNTTGPIIVRVQTKNGVQMYKLVM